MILFTLTGLHVNDHLKIFAYCRTPPEEDRNMVHMIKNSDCEQRERKKDIKKERKEYSVHVKQINYVNSARIQ